MLIARRGGGGWGRGREEDVGWGAGIDKKEPEPRARKREEKGHVATSSTKKKQLKGKCRNKTERKKDWIRKEEVLVIIFHCWETQSMKIEKGRRFVQPNRM